MKLAVNASNSCAAAALLREPLAVRGEVGSVAAIGLVGVWGGRTVLRGTIGISFGEDESVSCHARALVTKWGLHE